MVNKFPSYIIQHIQLDSCQNGLALPLINENGYYLVFWWKQVPLGQLYIERGVEPASDLLRNDIYGAIKPAVEAYSSEKELTSLGFKEAFLAHEERGLFKIMNKVLLNYLTPSVPASVGISVVICTRNRAVSLQRCLISLMGQKCIPAEIIVVDNAPIDETTKEVVEKFTSVVYYREPRLGLDIARNRGAKQASHPVVAYVDDDVIVHPYWSLRIWESFIDKNVAAMTGLVIAT
ncbi:MAG: glycosyltransferase family A protein, partial [Chitinophagaceae bacterium]